MTKIAYITRVTIPNNVAQAQQITSMARAFNVVLGNEFLLVSPSKNNFLKDDLNFCREIIKVKTTNKILKNILFSVKAFSFLKKNNIKTVYTRDVLISLISTWFFGIPTFYEAHQPLRSFPSRVLQFLVSRRREYKLVTITNSLKEYYSNRFNYKNEIRVIPNGVHLPDYEINKTKKEIREELNLSNVDFIIVHTGSLFENRGFEKFEVILKNFPKIRLIQLGGNKSDIQNLNNKLSSYDNIDFIEYQPKSMVVKYQLAADLLLYLTSSNSPIYWYTSPNKIFEYMATKNPILAPNIGSIPEILNESNSYLFDLTDDNDMIKKIDSIIINRNPSVAIEAYKQVINNYSMESRVKKILSLV